MVELQVYDADGKAKEKLSFDESVFGDKVKSRTLREVVLAYSNNQRQGTSGTKNLSDVSGSNKKPFKQKGTGRARQGQKRANFRKKGQVAHGPHPRSYNVRIPAKMKKLALESALLDKFRSEAVSVVDGLSFDQPKTSQFASFLKTAELDKGSFLLAVDKQDRNLYLSVRNVPRSMVRSVSDLNAYEIMRQRHLLLTREAVDLLKSGVRSAPKSEGSAK